MTVLCKWVFLTSLFMTPLILLLLFLMPKCIHRYKPGFRTFVWLAALAGLVVPLFIGEPLSANLQPFTEAPKSELSTITQAITQEMTQPLTFFEYKAGAKIFHTSFRVVDILYISYISGMVLFLLIQLYGYFHTSWQFRRWAMPVTDPILLKQYLDLCKQLQLSKIPQLYLCKTTSSPLLIGLRRPRIYIPQESFDQVVLLYALRHELWHYKRRDLHLKGLLLLIQTIHWFNPAVHAMMRQIHVDIEVSCDRSVLRGAHESVRRQYGLALLSFLDVRNIPLSTKFYGGKTQMKIRVQEIMNRDRKKCGMLLSTFIFALVLACGISVVTQALRLPESTENTLPFTLKEDKTWPVPGHYQITLGLGFHTMPDGSEDFSTGIHISDDNIYGADVVACDYGRVTTVENPDTPERGFGKYIIISHRDNTSTLYAYLSEIDVVEGQEIERGQKIGAVGNKPTTSEPCFQLDVRKHENQRQTYEDPIVYLSAEVSNPQGLIKKLKM